MEYTTLGRTGLTVSRLGLGCGGPSRLGLKHGATRAAAVRVIRHALDGGINFLDTAQAYTTEPEVAQAVRESGRDDIVISTKVVVANGDRRCDRAALSAAADRSLGELRTDCIDILHLHGVRPAEYAYAAAELVPAMIQLRDAGKIRFLGITEDFNVDVRHEMFQLATADDCWDVVMVGFNILNQSARSYVLPWARQQNCGILGMFAVRRALGDPQRLRAAVQDLVRQGLVTAEHVDVAAPLDFLIRDCAASSVVDAAYRFARDEPGMQVVLCGTGNLGHLDENLRSMSRPPLPAAASARLREIFARVEHIAGN